MTHRTAGDLAQFLGCTLEGDAAAPLSGLTSPERARREDLIYLDSRRHADRVQHSAAQCVIAASGVDLPGKTILRAPWPKLAFARAGAWLVPPPTIAEGVHPSAIIAPSASLGSGVAVGPYAVIEDGVAIGSGTQIGAHSFVGRGAKLGSHCRIYPRVTVYAGAHLGDRVIVHSGAVLGSDGFGYVTDHGAHWKFPQNGLLEIGDDVEIGANTTIDRGSLEITSIGAQAKIDNLVHVAHNVRIGERALIAAQVGIAGSATIGNDVMLGGQAGLGEHCHIEDQCAVGGQSGVLNGKLLRRGSVVWGTPARPLDRFKEQYASLARLPEWISRLRKMDEDG